MVYYRKYRSQTINELDSESVRNTLFSVLAKEDTIPHAFLFTGPKGLGKTSAARIVAKAVNCIGRSKIKDQRSKTKLKNPKRENSTVNDFIEPCNECEQCKSITIGTNMDILEIDAASNRGIDEIRDLREKIRLSPLSARKKVYIIDEVHMLTTEAFNALLKTLEEPPAHAMFVLCTTEPHKVPATIISRCFHIQFKLATDEEIVRSLGRVAAGEKIRIDDDALYSIAKMAEGGFRDATKILEETVLLAKEERITKDFIENSYKFFNIYAAVIALLKGLSTKDVKAGLEIVKNLIQQGSDIKYFINNLLIAIHLLLLEKAGVENNGGPFIESLSKSFTLDQIKELVDIFSKAYAEMKTAVLPQLPLELAIIEYAIKDARGEGDKAELNKNEVKDDKVTVASLRRQAGTITKIKALYGSSGKQNASARDTSKTSEPAVDPNLVGIGLMDVPANGEVTPEWIAAFWNGIISEMKKYNHTIAGVLRGCSIKKYDRKSLVIQAAYKFHKERLETLSAREALINACKTLTGNDVKIEVELKKT